jgi:ATP-dependent exoDNAse (exonuclease V) alpha subunit
VDEAGLLSARECHALIQKAELEKTRVIFVGDTRQLSSVGAGNPFKLMQEKGIETAHLTESRRQKTRELKSAVSLLAEGKTEHAVTQLERQVHELRREKTRIDHVTKTYLQMDSDERSQTLILAGTNRERDLLTENIRGGLKQMNALGEVGILRSLRPRDLTPEQARSSVNLTAGDVVVFHRDFKNQGIKKGEAYEILSSGRDITEAQTQSGETIRFSPRKQPAFVVYEKHEAEFAVGDRVRWTRNDKTLGVRNGQDAIVSELRENQITVQNSDKKSVTLPLSSMLHLDHNYVNTVFSSQGKTCNNVIISTDRTFGKEAFYVAVSRARNSVKIFTEDKAEMMSCISKSKAKRSVLELVPERLFENQIAKELTVHQDHSQSQKHFRRRTRTR